MRTKLIALVAGLVLVVAAAVVVVVLVVGGDDEPEAVAGGPTSESTGPSEDVTDPDDPAFKIAESETVEDSVYPNVGDPVVDALHYDLDLTWDPEEEVLDGVAQVAFRATADRPQFQLDFAKALEVSGATLDGEEVEIGHVGKDLVVRTPVRADERYLLRVEYSGTPEPTAAPTTRSDFTTTGLNITDEGWLWTMQEPYGAFTWYPVNDQPADKALYDFTITAPAPMTGIANGELVSKTEVDGNTVTEWHLDTPASSYLTTLAVGEYTLTEDESASGVPLTYWTPVGDTTALEAMQFTREAFDWLEEKLGPYPYDYLGSVVVDSESAMETQTMITYGDTEYTLSPAVVVHEIAHHWYGDTVSPTDWRDVWMNEGMAMYVQAEFEAEQRNLTVDQVLDQWAPYEKMHRAQSGPPGDYDPRTFGQSNIYYGPALMWHELRQKLGDEAFWSMVKKWPTVHKDGNATREQYLDWIEQETGEELTKFFDAWLMGKTTPKRS